MHGHLCLYAESWDSLEDGDRLGVRLGTGCMRPSRVQMARERRVRTCMQKQGPVAWLAGKGIGIGFVRGEPSLGKQAGGLQTTRER